MTFYLETALFINRAPFDNIKLNFKKNGINVLSAMNGKGKTTILSYIADAFYELAKMGFYFSFESDINKYYRIESINFAKDIKKSSIVYLRFKLNDENIDYIDCMNINLTEEEYDTFIDLEEKISFRYLNYKLFNRYYVKFFSQNTNSNLLFNDHVLTFFPSYRFEYPIYLNKPYKFKTEYKLESSFDNVLKNPLEVVTTIRDIANWIMDVVFDWANNQEIKIIDHGKEGVSKVDETPEIHLYGCLVTILAATLASKYESGGQIKFSIGRRGSPDQRLAISRFDGEKKDIIVPNIFSLSAGELSLLCLFCEILRQSDNLVNNISLEKIKGIVLIDEVDMHLHIKLQKEVLPRLFSLFPNVQFIVSSHSPFFNIGLADTLPDKSQIIDLDNHGISCEPRDNLLYKQVYDMMVDDNNKFASLYNQLQQQINLSSLPLIITEGKTDVLHIKTALQRLHYTDIKVEWFDFPEEGWGYDKLKGLLESIAYLKPKRKIIGIFDRDVDVTLKNSKIIDKTYIRIDNTNVFAFAIPPVNKNIYGIDKISIEHYYLREDLLKENNQGRRLFLGEEFYESRNSKEPYKYQTGIDNIKNKVKFNGIIDEKVFLYDDIEFKQSVAMSKNEFARLVNEDATFSENFDFSNFKQIINLIKKIIDLE